MPRRLRNRLKFQVERYVQRGALYQLLLIVGVIVLVALLGGLAVWAVGGFEETGEAIWWAFLRLTDPGYLGDDEGAAQRTISTILTVLGFVLFVGSLIAILTQWLNQTMRTLESGLTPIAVRNHLLILGWTNRTPTVVHELVLSSGRVRRFLRRYGARRLRIVILTDEVDAALRQELREELGEHWDKRQIIFRSGSSLRIEHLERVNFRDAAVIILPGADFALGGAEASDTRVVKTLMSISNYSEGRHRRPPVVAEIADAQKVPIAEGAYEGEVDLIASDAFISRLMVQNVRHRGLSHVYTDLLSYGTGHEVYVRSCPEFAGWILQELHGAFPEAILLGAVRPAGRQFRPHLLPPADFVLQEDDRLVLIARDYEDTTPAGDTAPSTRTEKDREPPEEESAARRILLMGWSNMVPALVQEFSSYPQERFVIDVVSVVPAAEREDRLARLGVLPERVQLQQLEGDYTVGRELRALEPARYDNILLLSSDWLESGEESDARTVLGYVLLHTLLPEREGPEILVELMDPSNAKLFRQRTGEVIISPQVVSHLLAHVALRRELNAVFGELFGSGGAEIFFRTARTYGLAGQEVSFRDVQRWAARHGEIALGLRLTTPPEAEAAGLLLNPPLRQRFSLQEHDEVVVLTRYG